MDGLNAKFKADPKGFLNKYPVIEPGGDVAGQLPAKGGVVAFDFRPHGEAAVISDFAHRGKAEGANSEKIEAHWLPWESAAAPSVRLTSKASYFFTSQLAGCQIRIVPAGKDEDGPLVLHIAGDVSSDKRQKLAAGELSGDQMARSRALSSTGAIGTSGGYRGEGVNVIGFKSKSGEWEFLAQQVNFPDEPGGKFSIARVWSIP